MYARSLADQINTLLHEPNQRLWTFDQADPRARRALRVVEALRLKGLRGPEAVRDFQRAEKIAVDGIVGPVTLHRLGLGPKP
jgi:peptidoglycan hydrolase-like protein with peptidoglycan-binding domain